MSMIEKKRKILTTKFLTNNLPLYEKEFPLIFFWTPKGGCTSLIKWYYFQIGLLQKAIDYNPWVHFYRMEVYEKQKNYKVTIAEQILAEKKDTYKLVRNPYKRAVSSFFATIGNKDIMNQVAPAGSHNGLSFKQFLYRVKNIGVKKELINLHIAQQYVEEEELFIRNFVRLENFRTKISDIEKKYNLLKSPILEIIKSHHHMAQEMTDKGNKTFAEINMSMETLSKSIPEYKNFYDEETKALVKELFKNDFEKYGYNPNDLN